VLNFGRTPHRGRANPGGAAPSRCSSPPILGNRIMSAARNQRPDCALWRDRSAARRTTISVDEGAGGDLASAPMAPANRPRCARSLASPKPRPAGEILFRTAQSIAGLGPENHCPARPISHVPGGAACVYPALLRQGKTIIARRVEPPGWEIIRIVARSRRHVRSVSGHPVVFQRALGWTLSGGQLQMVAVARGLMAKPRLLLS